MSTFTAHCNLTRTVDFRKVSCDETFNNRDDYLAHFHKLHGGPKSVKSRKPSLKWRTPARKAFTPSGITHGATVVGAARPQNYGPMVQGVTGQLWSQIDVSCYGGRMWWVVDEQQRAWIMHEMSMTVLGQCVVPEEPLFS